MILNLQVAGLRIRVQVNRQPRPLQTLPRDFRADSQQQVLHLLYGASAPPR